MIYKTVSKEKVLNGCGYTVDIPVIYESRKGAPKIILDGGGGGGYYESVLGVPATGFVARWYAGA